MYETLEALEASETTQMAAVAAFGFALLCMLVCHLLPMRAQGYVHPMNEADPETVGRLRRRVRFYGLFIAATCVHYVAGRMMSEQYSDQTNMALLAACIIAAIISAVLVLVWIFRHVPVWLAILLVIAMPLGAFGMAAAAGLLLYSGQALLCCLSVFCLLYSMCRLLVLKWPAPGALPARETPPPAQPAPPPPPTRKRKVFITVLKLLGPDGRELVIKPDNAFPVPYVVGRAAYLHAGDASGLVEDAQFYVKATSANGRGAWYLSPVPAARNKVYYAGSEVAADVLLENDKGITLATPDGTQISIPLRTRFRPLPQWSE